MKNRGLDMSPTGDNGKNRFFLDKYSQPGDIGEKVGVTECEGELQNVILTCQFRK